MRLAIDKQAEHAKELLAKMGSAVGDGLVDELLKAEQGDEAGIEAQRARVKLLEEKLAGLDTFEARWLSDIADYLVRKSVWIVGGDGWAYDIGYGGLDRHRAGSRREHPRARHGGVLEHRRPGVEGDADGRGGSSRWPARAMPKKDLAMLAMTYGHPYVARVALGAKDAQTVNAFKEADSYTGTSVIVAYSHCIAHGYEMSDALGQQERRSTPATGRSSATTRAAWRRARARSSSTARRRRSTSPGSSRTRRASARSRRRTRGLREDGCGRRRTSASGTRCTSSSPAR